MSKTVAEWMLNVKNHYGSLDAFKDAPSVRTMRRFAQDTIDEHERILDQISPDKDHAYRVEFDGIFAEEQTAAKAQVEELDKWLADRGLTL